MPTQSENANLFSSLHVKGNPIILFNIWDAGSAQAVQEAGAKAVATGSRAAAAAHGYGDGEELPLDLAVANLKRIIAIVDVPVTFDFESGYGKTPTEVAQTVTQVIEAGAVGINFEDQIIGGDDTLYSVEDQVARIKAIREAADKLAVPFFINARTDVFLMTNPTTHNEAHLEETIQRAAAYAEAGASGFFAPGLRNAQYIEKLCDASPIPVNLLVMPDVPSSTALAELGVARISYGGRPYFQLIDAFKEAARKALAGN
ncbi:MAG: isocitrate lyase/phosphoenolpyruvate mutase family protein [Burkholderiales bacterium]|nr:isocitrate lyase/phosphoenolpyruvate mutase family protein [Anaerolineae bacterium]